MNAFVKYIGFLSLVLNVNFLVAQVDNTLNNTSNRFTVRGSVIESDTKNPIPNVNIEVSGGAYTTTDIFGEFKVEAKKGDELIVRHADFETVYYIIKSNERIKVEVLPNKTKSEVSKFSFLRKFTYFTFCFIW